MADYQQFDNEESLREAKRKVPLNVLMEQHGDTPPPIGMKWGPCPICKKKTTARITDGPQLFFKCANDTCPSQTAGEGNAWTELHYLAFKTGYTGKDVFIAYLKLTNVWKDVEKYKGPAEGRVPSKQAISGGAGDSVESTELTPGGQQNGDTPAPAGRPAPQAEVGQGAQPADGVEPSAIGPVAESDAGSNPAGATPGGGPPRDDGGQKPDRKDDGTDEDEEAIQNCIAVVMEEGRASVSLLQRRLRLGYTRANRIMGELERRGVVGPAKGIDPRDVLIKKADVPKSAAQLLDDDIAKFVDYVQKAEKRVFNFMDIEKVLGFARAKEVLDAMKERKVVSPIGTDGNLELTPKPAPTVKFISNRTGDDKPKTEQVGKIDGEDGYAALHDFFTQLSLSPDDEELLFKRRGLISATSEALRFRSNPRLNRGILLAMRNKFSKEELLDSGLFVRVKGAGHAGEIKPNSQFCGAGIMRKLKEGETVERNQWKDNDGNLWGWCEPILIPYFDEIGRLVGLRPHKGGGQANTVTGSPRIYIPRVPPTDGKPIQEIFPKVVITEGEFKAAALWQTVGGGCLTDGGFEPYGVVALPGIWFGQNYGIREELDQWLRDVRCRVVKVAYDNEDKSNPELESFKSDRRKRFDAEICARVLATDIANKLHIRGEVCRLPDAWRNEKGKADWDGALVKITQPKKEA